MASHRLMVWRGPDGDPGLLPLVDGGFHVCSPWLCTDDVHMIRLAALSARGVAYIPDGQLGYEEHDVLEPVLPELVGRPRHLWLCVPKPLHDVPRVKAVREMLLQVINQEGLLGP